MVVIVTVIDGDVVGVGDSLVTGMGVDVGVDVFGFKVGVGGISLRIVGSNVEVNFGIEIVGSEN
jgi:hypothetical protein